MSQAIHTPAFELIQVARTLLKNALDPAHEFLIGQFPERPRIDRDLAPQSLPVLRWLERSLALANFQTEPLVRLLMARATALQWRQTYKPEDFGEAFLQSYGWTELVGERGPFASERIAAGFLMLGPDVNYPDHSHQAKEIYIPLSGTAQWRKDDGDWRVERPGSVIEHRSWQIHAIRTASEPLLAFYVWWDGNLSQKSRIKND